MAAWLWSANASIRDATDATVAMSNAALALPGITTATLLAGAATALYTVGWIRNRRPELRARAVWAASAAAGLSLGVVAGATILIGYGTRGSILVLALTVAVAGTGGGLAAGPAPRGVVAAGLSAMLAQFLVGFALNLFQHPLLDLMGDGDGARAHLAASARLALTESLVAGLVAGVVAFAHLRRQACGWRFPAYLAAGATAGLLLLVAEPITRIGGAQLFDRVSGLSPADAAWQEMFASGRINQALVVLFVGAITALVLFGRTLRPAERAS
ncbi:MAG: hypothetical protein J2P15_04955 [Micromonosporaceae bacterium]|nr:hypothetical protein [Micromonosporaceae bacterium]